MNLETSTHYAFFDDPPPFPFFDMPIAPHSQPARLLMPQQYTASTTSVQVKSALALYATEEVFSKANG